MRRARVCDARARPRHGRHQGRRARPGPDRERPAHSRRRRRHARSAADVVSADRRPRRRRPLRHAAVRGRRGVRAAAGLSPALTPGLASASLRLARGFT